MQKKLTKLKTFSDVSSKVQLVGRVLKFHYPKFTVLSAVEHTVSLFFNDVSKILILHQIIYFQMM